MARNRNQAHKEGETPALDVVAGILLALSVIVIIVVLFSSGPPPS